MLYPLALMSTAMIALTTTAAFAAKPAQLDDGLPTTLRPANYKAKYPTDNAAIVRGENSSAVTSSPPMAEPAATAMRKQAPLAPISLNRIRIRP